MLSNYGMFEPNKGGIVSSEQKQNIEGIYVYFDSNHIGIQKKMHTYKGYNKDMKNFLVINRKTQQIKVQETFDIDKMTKRVFSAFLGIVIIKGYRFVVLCDQAKICSNVDSIMIYEIASLYFLSYLSDKELSQKPERKQIFEQIRQLYEILRIGFYFSYKYNLTQSFQHQQMGIKNRFTWNMRFLKELEKYKIQREWCLPLIQGFVSSFQVIVQGTNIFYILISRRSNQKAGTRYFDRGVDENGYVANFVYTEQIIKIEDYLISDSQIRGSVPIFFQQKGLRTLVKLTRGFELTHQIYEKHLQKLKDTYRRIFIVNLLCKSKNGQRIVIDEFQKHVKQNKLDKNVKYMYFDFHKAVADGNYANVDVAIEKVRQMKYNLGYYIFDTSKKEVMDQPEGIFRSNCLDCLDRTNFFQAKLALVSLENIFSKFNITTENLLNVMNSGTQENDLIKKFRNIWADNGDMISFHYTGTGSTHTEQCIDLFSITRDGKRGLTGEFKHKYKSIARFYNQNFWDFHKMNLVDLILGQNTSNFENKELPEMLKSREEEYLKKHLLDIYIFSWKVPSKVPKSLTLFPTTPHVIAINLQQVKQPQTWGQIIKQAIDQKYVLIGQKLSNNNLLKIYLQQQYVKLVSNVQLTKVKFKSYYNQIMSTKCAVIIRFTFASSKVVFCGCQLQYGRQFSANRIRNLRDLHQYAFQEVKVGEKKSSTILNDDVIFLIGNMNTHVSAEFKEEFSKFKLDNSGLQKKEKRELIEKMLQTDEFSTQIKQSLLEFRQYEQQQIQFLPTYKYSGNSFDPDVSGWPDRIWYSTNNKIICSQYTVIEELREAHVPVVGSYQIQVDQIDEQRKANILEEIIRKVSTKETIQEYLNSQSMESINTQVVEAENTPLSIKQIKKELPGSTGQIP